MALTQGCLLMSLDRDRTAYREETDKSIAQVFAVRRSMADKTADMDYHLVPCGHFVGTCSGPELINAPGFNWVL